MTDFELQRDLRALRGPRQPQTDLWAGISARIESRTAMTLPSRKRRWLPLATAAALALAVSAGLFSLALQRQHVDRGQASIDSTLSVSEQITRARELAASGDPRLAGAEVVLDAASTELEHALQQQPDAVFLVGLINRTHAQRRKLARLGMHAG